MGGFLGAKNINEAIFKNLDFNKKIWHFITFGQQEKNYSKIMNFKILENENIRIFPYFEKILWNYGGR